jgi:hypothetical protein
VADAQVLLLFWTFAGFQAKHLLCDFILQTRYQVRSKGYYGRSGGLIHAGCHALLSIPVLLILTRAPLLIAALALGELAIHYHIDWLKARTERLKNWTIDDPAYWIAFGIDQFLHQMTYLGMAGVCLWAAP